MGELRLSQKIALGILILLGVFLISYAVFGHGLIKAGYEQRSINRINDFFQGRNVHSVEHYLKLADGNVQKLTIYSIAVCLLLICSTGFKVVLCSFLIVFLLIEGSFQLYFFYIEKKFPNDTTHTDILWMHDPLLGWKHEPGMEEYYTNQKNKFKTLSKINPKGLRDKKHTYEKPEGRKRILMIGDSGVAGLEVEKEYTIDYMLEDYLNKHGTFEVINAGVRGYGTDQSYIWLTSEGVKYNPDIIIYIFFPNDPENNMSYHRPYRLFGKGCFIIDEHYDLKLTGVPVPQEFDPPDQWLMSDKQVQTIYNIEINRHKKYDRTRVVNRELLVNRKDVIGLIKKDLLHLKLAFSSWATFRWMGSRIRNNPQLNSMMVALKIMSPKLNLSPKRLPEFVLTKQWQITERIIKEMALFANQIDAKFLVYEFSSTGKEVEPTRLKKACNELGLPYLNAFRQIRKDSKRGVLHFPYDEHWNRRGHELTAGYIYDYLISQHWIE
ncbi:MAG: SGNH/GDSL hydrolase family protein [Candidatus Omnitrophica bacterium]|nr:SGNH/GDSL hydrolase family protein [Candidatus Omnitrophota bacterium]MCB9747994.1 SGNH/GDSL hydrolase family protein [Candidatus Omnitrophota bacterium]